MPQPETGLARIKIAAAAGLVAILLRGQLCASEDRNVPARALGERDVPADMKFEPSWRERGDCGPVSLYALLRLCGFRSTIREVKQALPFDSDVGCSLAAVARAASALGLDASIRFVNSRDVLSIPRPFMLHSTGSIQRGIGHFTVIVGYSPATRLYSVIDADFGGTDLRTEDAVLRGYSGYVLVPEQAQYGPTRFILSALLSCVGQIFAVLALSACWRSHSRSKCH